MTAPLHQALSSPAWLVRGAAFWAALLVVALFTSTALLNLAALGMSLWATAAWAQMRPWHLLRQPVALAILGLLGWMLLREAFATASASRTLWVLVEFRVLLFAVLWAPLFIWVLPRRWAGGALLTGCVLAAAAALGYLAVTGLAVGGHVYRLAPNIGGQLMVIGVFGWALVALDLLKVDKATHTPSTETKPRRLALVFLALLLAALCVSALLFASLRRTGYVVLLGGAMAFVTAQFNSLSRRQLAAVLVAITLGLVAAAASPVVQKRVNDVAIDLQRYQAAGPKNQGQLDVSSGIRLRMWQISTQMWRDKPLAGSSLSYFVNDYKHIDNARGGSLVESFNPHNEYLQMAAMWGAVGLLLYLAIYLALLHIAWQWRGTTQGTLVLVCTAAFASSVLMNSMLIDMMEGHLFALVLAGLAFHRWSDEPHSRAA